MNERAKLAQIIVQAIEEFPKVHKFLTSGDTGCHPQHLVDVIADRILARQESELFDVICPGCRSKDTYPIKREEKENGVFTQFGCHACRSVWEARTMPPETLRENILTGVAAELKAMLDEALEENDKLEKRLMEGLEAVEFTCAATAWVKWIPKSPLGPSEHEWCLWSTVAYGWRQCIYGYLEQFDGKLILSWEGQPWEKYGRVIPDDTTWWARVRPVP